MKRDMELIRKIMINIQDGDLSGCLPGYDDDTVNYHKARLKDKGLIEAKVHYSSMGDKPPDIPDLMKIERMTWEGHAFIDAVKKEENWNKIKRFLTQTGKDLTIGSIKYAAKQLFGFPDS